MLYFLAKMKLVRSMLGPQASLRPLSEASPSLQEAIRTSGPLLRGYERLASFYHELAQTFCPDYPAFLRVLGKKHRRPLRAILDLACGIGFLTPRLAVDAELVVGLDLSEEMLAGARARCAGLANVRLVKADFREFTLRQ